MNQFNIMFTCAGRRIALMGHFRDALAQLGCTGKILATDITFASPAIHKADVGLLVPCVHDSGYIPALLDHVRRHEVKLLVPLTDIDLTLLARNRGDFEQAGCTVMIGSESAVSACVDKASTNALIARAGLSPVRTLMLDQFLAQPFYPCFVKPVRGSAGVGSSIIRNEYELREHMGTFGQDLIVQEYLSGQEYTIDVYRSRDGKVHCVVPRQRLVVRSGEVEKAMTVHDDALIEAGRRLGELVDGLWGVFCCQCRRGADGESPRFFEINPRFGGGSPLSIAAGANLPLYLLQEVMGRPITAKLGEFTDKLLMLRYDDALYVQADDIQNLPGYRSPQFR